MAAMSSASPSGAYCPSFLFGAIGGIACRATGAAFALSIMPVFWLEEDRSSKPGFAKSGLGSSVDRRSLLGGASRNRSASLGSPIIIEIVKTMSNRARITPPFEN
jgi:hypothetical protein